MPRTMDDLLLRRKMMTHWAWVGCGMMARTPDFMNVSIAGWAGAAEYFGGNRPEFAENVRNYHEFIREKDVTLTHTLVNLQPRRAGGVLDQLDEQVALTVVKETDAGIIVRGSRVLATLGPISDEIAVYPTRTHMIGPESWRQAFSFAIPNSTPGVKFICRESFDYGRSNFDHPLGSRFEEMDCIVFFDDVLVPWERVFLLGDVEMCNNYGIATQSTTHSGYQVVNRCVVKTEFILGLAQLMADTLGSGELQHVQERIAEIIIHLETLKACMRASEADAWANDFGVMCPAQGPITVGRALYPTTIYPRLAEIVQLLGSGNLMALPSEGDFDAAIGPEVERYLTTDTADARERVGLLRLAWDVACSAFGGRQVLYERFFGGDPTRNALLLYRDLQPGRRGGAGAGVPGARGVRVSHTTAWLEESNKAPALPVEAFWAKRITDEKGLSMPANPLLQTGLDLSKEILDVDIEASSHDLKEDWNRVTFFYFRQARQALKAVSIILPYGLDTPSEILVRHLFELAVRLKFMEASPEDRVPDFLRHSRLADPADSDHQPSDSCSARAR